jgi:hypothetical protein
MKMPRRVVYPLTLLPWLDGYMSEAYLLKPDATAPILEAQALNPMQLKRLAWLWR